MNFFFIHLCNLFWTYYPSVTQKKQFRGHTVLQTSHTILSLSARYQQDFDTGMSIAAAERFYQQALMLFPEMGLYFCTVLSIR